MSRGSLSGIEGQGRWRSRTALAAVAVGERACACSRRAVSALLACLLAAGLLAAPARAQLRGTISGPGQTAFPVGIAAPRGDAEIAKSFVAVLVRDLELSGLFSVVRPPPVGGPADRGIETGELDLAGWTAIGARWIVGLAIQRDGSGAVGVEARLIDAADGQSVGGKRYQGSRAEVAQMGDRFADHVLFLLTGERGPFDSALAFISTRGGRFKEIWMTPARGDAARPLTQHRSIHLSPNWAPDAHKLLFTSFMQGRPAVYEINVDSLKVRKVMGGSGTAMGASFSPSGDAIALAREVADGDSQIVVLRLGSKKIDVVSSEKTIDVSPSWSPDGRRLAFCSGRAGTPQIFIADLDAGTVRRLSFQGGYNTEPAWSPKGDRIAYTGRIGGRFQIFVHELEENRVQQVTNSGGDNTSASWSPDSRYLAFSSSRSGRDEVWLSDWHGWRQTRLIEGSGGDTSPAWSGWLE